MKIQNLAIIFLTITIPLILILTVNINTQRGSLKTQAEYDLKLSEATKEGIRAYEINTVNWRKSGEVNERTQVNAMVNAFITSLENKLNLGISSKEYMQNYIPAVVATMYDGYYIYAPSKVPINFENNNGVQLYLNSANKLTTDGTDENKPLYIAKEGKGHKYQYDENDVNGSSVGYVSQNVTTNISDAETQNKYILSSKIAYSEKATSLTNSLNLAVNYTLDNRIYVYGTQNDKYIEKEGYLVSFDSDTELPTIKIKNKRFFQNAIDHSIVNTIYSKTEENGNKNKTLIEPETLEEQIIYYDETSGEYRLETFKYLYDAKHRKLYYDDGKDNFFMLDEDNKRNYLSTDNSIIAGDEECYYKYVSVVTHDEGDELTYRKIFQVLNGKNKGMWYINFNNDSEELEKTSTKIRDVEVDKLGLTYNNPEIGVDYSPIYKDFSAISYYVEAYVFTNWINEHNLRLENGQSLEAKDGNDPEKSTSDMVKRKRQIIADAINNNLSLAISNYGQGINDQFYLPVLTESDWEQIYGNISLITFFQGVPTNSKTYNGYSIATSTANDVFVDPGQLYYRADGDENFHRVYCRETKNLTYTGYRASEFTTKEFKDPSGNTIYYYMHDNSAVTDSNAETACYYCIVNNANYTQIKNGETNYKQRTYKQAKSYNEALARERYYPKIERKLPEIEKPPTNHYTINYYNGDVKLGFSEHIYGVEEPLTSIAALKVNDSRIPGIEAEGWRFNGWTRTNGSLISDYEDGYIATNLSTLEGGIINLYAVWQRTANFYSGANKATVKTATQYMTNISVYSVEIPSMPDEFEPGWESEGWRADTKAETKKYNLTGAITGNVGPDFYAIYTREVTFNSGINKSTSKTSTQYYNTANNYAVEIPGGTASINGWTLEGWRDDAEATVKKYDATGIITEKAGPIFNAIYSQILTLEYDKNTPFSF